MKNLFWPTIRHGIDVEYLGHQGFWLCLVLAAFTLFFSWSHHQLPYGLVDVLFWILSGIGIRQRSRFAAAAAFVLYLLSQFVVTNFSISSLIFLALLLSNIRATWLSAKWLANGTEPPSLPLNETWMDKAVDVAPPMIWPWAQWVYYLYAAGEVTAVLFVLERRFRH